MTAKPAAKVKVSSPENIVEMPQPNRPGEATTSVVVPASAELTPEIGHTAGKIWQTLSNEGPVTLAQLKKKMDASGEVVSFAVGWLAREDKVEIQPDKRNLRIALR